jgi:SAM-dependent methyltransferase
MKSSESEILNYYNEFYENDDFTYYNESITGRFLKSILGSAGIKPGAKILDIGCGTGYYTNIFTKLGYDALGIDYSTTAITKAKEKYPRSKFEVIDGSKLPYEKKSFDFIFLFGCTLINHVEPVKINEYLEYVRNYINEGGSLVYIGGSNLKGNFIGESEWYNHRFNDLLKIKLNGIENYSGPYLTHFRIIQFLGKSGYNKFLNIILKLSLFDFKRMVIIFFKIGK